MADAFMEWFNDSYNSLRYDFTQTRELPMGKVLLPIVEEVLAASKPPKTVINLVRAIQCA